MSAPMTAAAREALAAAGLSRRNFCRAAGALIVGFHAAGQTGPFPGNQVDSWLAIAADDTVTAYAGRCDFGQGFRTVQHQLVAEELDVPFERVKMIICDTAQCPDQGVSSGSQGHPAQFGPRGLRAALATARAALLDLAAQRLGVPVAELTVENGVVRSRTDTAKAVRYGELIGGRRLNLAVNGRAPVKDPRTYKVLGRSVPRLDVAPKATGEFTYVHNIRVPGMWHARVVRPPEVGAKVVSVDQASASAGVRVVVRKDFVAVAAPTQWQAAQAAEKLAVRWSAGDPLPARQTLYERMRRMPSRDSYTVVADDVDAQLQGAARRFAATYLHPFQLHGSLGTSCAVADVRADGTATVWSASQGIYPQRDSLALVLGIPREKIRCIFVEGSGCYGLNGADAVAYDAAVVSQAIGLPVRLQYSRRDEMAAGESFGPAYVIDLKAGVDAQGRIVAWDYESWTFSKGGRPCANSPGNVVSGGLLGFPAPEVRTGGAPARPGAFRNNGNVASAYGTGCVEGVCGGTGKVKSERALTHTIPSPFYTGPLRSPARLQNTFANECFIDEIAAALRQDPVEYRRRHLADPRLIEAMDAAARAAGWDRRPSPRPGNPRKGVARGRGISIVLYEGDNGYGALVAEVEVNQDTGRVVVKRLVASNDSGPVSNPDGLKAQIEGGALQGMSRALYEELDWTGGRIASTDWNRFRVLRFGDPIPAVESVLIHRPDQPHMGAGETIITLAAAAIGNAIFDATGARIREAPFTPERVKAAIARR